MIGQILRTSQQRWTAKGGQKLPQGSAPTFQELYAPLPIRLGNALVRRVDALNNRWPSLEPETLRRAAERRTGLSDSGDGSFDHALEALVDSLEQEGELTLFGRFALRQFLVQNLSNRLLVQAVLNRFPEIHRVEIERPIFIVGWYRTGTTLLHNLLAELPYLRAPLLWELRSPCPPGDPRTGDPRQRDPRSIVRGARLVRRIHRYLAPHFETVHPMRAEKPEECLHLFENANVSATSFFVSEAKSFAWWLLEQDLRSAYRFYRSQLQLLQWLRPGRRWVLKWPYHLWHLDALLDVFPDARIIHTHRDPQRAIPSVCSLAAIARSTMCDHIDAEALGRFWLDYSEAGLERAWAARKRVPAGRISDVQYADLVNDPVATVAQIYEDFGIEMSEDSRRRITQYLRENPRHKNGVHRYDLRQFGLDAEVVRERYRRYGVGSGHAG